MGMGLAISRSIIEAHAGRLWAEPNQAAGATFLISLPRRSVLAKGGLPRRLNLHPVPRDSRILTPVQYGLGCVDFDQTKATGAKNQSFSDPGGEFRHDPPRGTTRNEKQSIEPLTTKNYEDHACRNRAGYTQCQIMSIMRSTLGGAFTSRPITVH